MPWLELRINTDRSNAPTQEYFLAKSGALSVTLQDNADQPIFEPALGETPLWKQTRVTGLFEADVDTKEIELKLKLPEGSHFVWHILEDKDWEREWMTHYHPIKCSEKLWICPSWTPPPQTDSINLILDPGLAFGTGTHATTFLCLQWLSQQSLSGNTVIDYGCGSGILGIASLLLGAENALGIDIDPQALIASQDNAERNKIDTSRFPVYFPDAYPATQADIVVANILAGPLVELAQTLNAALKPKGKICLSGILENQAETVQAAYSSFIQFDPIQCKDDWVCLSGVKTR